MAKYEAGFIGAGNMGGALALAAAKKTGGDRIAVACSTRERSEAAAQRLGCTAETPQRILSDSRFVFLGVKPQMVVGVVEGLKADILASEGIFVSMLAGVSLEKLALLLGADKKIIRIMPNTPCAVGQGLILYAANGRVSEDELCAFRELMAPAGALDELNEHLIDAASAVSGCGPAYAYLFIEALADGGVKNGLPRAKAQRYAAQMLLGSAEMVLRTGRHPGQLKDEVCSPGGSTIAGVAALERSGFRSACIEAVDAAVVEVGGFALFNDREKAAYLRRLAEARGVILLTDPDGAGFVLRSHLKGLLPPDRVKQAYVPDVYGKEKRKRKPGKEGKLGVEGMTPQVLTDALRRAGATFEGEDAPRRSAGITKADLLDKGLIGPGSAERRATLQRELGLPARLTANGLLEALDLLLTREEFDAL